MVPASPGPRVRCDLPLSFHLVSCSFIVYRPNHAHAHTTVHGLRTISPGMCACVPSAKVIEHERHAAPQPPDPVLPSAPQISLPVRSPLL